MEHDEVQGFCIGYKNVLKIKEVKNKKNIKTFLFRNKKT